MTRLLLRSARVVMAAALVPCLATAAEIEVKGPDGRRILLNDDRTWRYADDKPAAAEKPSATAVLYLEGRADVDRNCRFQLRLVNQLPYEIRSVVPEFSVHRANGVVYDSVLAAFQFIKPGDEQKREVRFRGIACQDVVRLQVSGGDRCEMGDLDKFSPVKGRCLALVRVEPSDLVRFDK